MKRIASAALSMLIILVLASFSFAAEPAGEKGKDDGPSYGFKFGGYFKADFAYDDARVLSGNFAIRVLPEEKNAVTSITARETRFAVDFWWLDKQRGIKTDAKLEIDFYGLGVQPLTYNSMENRAAPMLRHAYLKFGKGHWSALAGQTSDVLSPLVPQTVNYTVCWGIGNIGYRRPQFRFSTWYGDKSDMILKADFAIARTIGADFDGDLIDDGADAGIPTLQYRLGFDFHWGENGFTAIGASGHFGKEAFTDSNITTERFEEYDVESWSICGDFKSTITEHVSFSGEFFIGRNLGTYLGGVLQGINPYTGEAISSIGGWGLLTIKLSPRHLLNFGAGIDDPKNDHVLYPVGEGSGPLVTENKIFFWNWMYKLTDTVSAMLELSQLKTVYVEELVYEDQRYLGDSIYKDFRIQVALKAAIK